MGAIVVYHPIILTETEPGYKRYILDLFLDKMSHKVIPSGFVKSVLHSGVGRYVCQMQRITLKFCKSHADSRGMRYAPGVTGRFAPFLLDSPLS